MAELEEEFAEDYSEERNDNIARRNVILGGGALKDETTPLNVHFDVIVVGATEAGCMAAREAADAGCEVLLTSDQAWFGWMSSGYGLNQQDVKGSKAAAVVGGRTKKFLTSVAKQTLRRNFAHWWKYEGQMRPQFSKRAFVELLTHPNIKLLPNAQLVSLKKTGTTITSLLLDVDGVRRRYYPTVVVEGTACGDVNQKALASFSIGREANATHGETSNGIMAATKWDNNTDVDPYVTPATPSSGLLFGVDSGAAGTVGAADGRVMGFGFRPFLTSVAGEKISWATYFGGVPPTDYDPLRYELLARAFAANPTYYGDATNGLTRISQFYNLNFGNGTAMGTPITYVDMNSGGPLSINYPVTSELVEYVSASIARRAVIRANMKNYTLGWLYWLMFAADARIPATIRTALDNYGFSAYQLPETGGWSPQCYEREGARAVGSTVQNQTQAVLNNSVTDPIAFGFYDIDGHVVRRLVVGGLTYVEGAVLTSLGAGYGFRISMQILFPKATECTNLVCASQPSVSHVIWRCIRVGPSMMMIGSAGGAVAALAVKHGISVQDVRYSQVAALCDPWDIEDGTVVDSTATYGHGTITKTGASWVSGSSRYGGIGGSPPAYDTVLAANVAGHKWKAASNVYSAGVYDVYLQFSADEAAAAGGQGRATNLLVNVVTEQGTTAQTISQQVGGVYDSNGGRWEHLGRFKLRAGVPSADYVEIDCATANAQVTASAVKIVLADE
jgi:hypothetical protein